MNKTQQLVRVLAIGAMALCQPNLARAADANPPEQMTYQGYLVDGNGGPLGNSAPANYDIVFRIYNVKQGGTSIWAEQQTVTVDKGYFSVLLGEGSQYGSELHGDLAAAFDGADASDRFIGITVDIGGVATEIAPRLRLVSSPFAFTATQARRLTDGSGNSNFFKDGASLKLGAGSTPTLTLPEAGGASLDGKLTINLSGYEVGLEINNGGSSTTLGAENSSHFHFKTDRGGFYFNKEIRVFGDIHSQNADTILGPSNNTDTYLQVYDDSTDKIMAHADQFLVQGDSKYLQIKFTSTAAELRTDAAGFYMNRTLETAGNLTANGRIDINNTVPTLSFHDSGQESYALYVNSDKMYFLHRPDANSDYSADRPIVIEKNKVGIGKDSPAHTLDVAGDIATSGSLLVSPSSGLRSVTGDYGTVQTTGGGAGNWEGYSIGGRYVFMSHANQDGGIYYDTSNSWLTLYQPNGYANGRGMYRVFLASNDQQEKLRLTNGNGSLYASYDGDSNWDFRSDRRLKENIIKEDQLLDRIMNLDVVNFDFIGQEKKKHKDIGFIAQDIEPHFPSLVSEGKDDRYDFDVKALGYSSFGVIAVGGVKELKNEKDAEIAELRSENETLKSRMETLTSEMAVLKARLANSTTQEDRIAKLEELVSKIGQGE